MKNHPTSLHTWPILIMIETELLVKIPKANFDNTNNGNPSRWRYWKVSQGYIKWTSNNFIHEYWEIVCRLIWMTSDDGSVIIKNSLMPIGELSEEGAGARNKHFAFIPWKVLKQKKKNQNKIGLHWNNQDF